MLALARLPGVLFSGALVHTVHCPYIIRYWSERFREERYNFSNPNALDAAIQSGGPTGPQRILQLLTAVAQSVVCEIPAEFSGISPLFEWCGAGKF